MSTTEKESGVVAQGFEFETSLSPIRDLTMTVGITYSDTSYENNLVGRDTGAPLDPALRLLPGDTRAHGHDIPEFMRIPDAWLRRALLWFP